MTLSPIPSLARTPIAGRRPRISRAIRQRNRRVESHRDLVRPLAIHYARCSQEPSEDLLQVGLLGLIRAAELYRRELSTPFEAFARPHIRGAILHYLRDTAPVVRLPRRQAELQERLMRLSAPMGPDTPVAPSEEVRRQLRISNDQLNLLLRQRRLNRPSPLEGLLASGMEGRFQPLDPEEEESPWERSDGQPMGGPSAEQLLQQLEPRQRQVVRQAILEGASYRTIAAEMGISPMTVQRLLRRGLEQLRSVLDGARISSPAQPDPCASAAPGC